MHICVISEDYPYKTFSSFEFVKQLCVAFADNGITVSVVAPQSLTKNALGRHPYVPKIRTEETLNGHKICIYCPYMFTLGNIPDKIGAGFIIDGIRRKAIASAIKSMPSKPDVIYGHFWHSAYDAYGLAKKMSIPLFVASGESEIMLHKKYDVRKIRNFTDYISGVICVSTKNKKESVNSGLTKEEKCIVIPNAIDCSLFHKMDKLTVRKKFGYSPNDFIVAFVGSFITRKGPVRIVQAISMLNDPDVKVMFIGKPISNDISNIPECPGIVFRGPVPHAQLPDYLNCADVFVMPTLKEGCCNANIEAMACGLPIISSDLDFNYDILDESCSILIDPMNVCAIADAIRYLKDNPEKRTELSLNAWHKAQKLKIETRAQKITDFINERTVQN